ncbi:hypothetical protein BPAE_0298g00010 [Botrytis paeoniae]|uniref:Uncharacterized protein n=1 Tax=Botrytis paeoniae TaxID=278948 RepID=A0A4Z1FC90_9HELO|nr:hypothetical protein BPAE_0298g00010 [Botrytis paeoniae]
MFDFLDKPAFSVLGLSVVAYTLYYAITAIYLIFFHPLAKFPGPKLWAASRIPWARHVIQGDICNIMGDLHEKYGPVVRIGPDEITTISPTAWNDIYISKPVLPKDPYSQTPPLNGAHSLFTAAGDEHKRIRNTLIYAFSDKALRDQAPIVESYTEKLIIRLQSEASRSISNVVDIQKFYGYATFDMVTDLSFGESFHGLEQENEHSWILGFFFHAKFGTIRNCLGRFSPLDTLLGLILLGVTRKARERNWRVVTEKIEKRLSKGNLDGVRSDFMTPVIENINESKIKGITKGELITNGLAFVIADCQLTTVFLSTSTYLLLKTPMKLEELAKEVRGTFESNDKITVQSTNGLVYLEAVINETLRIHHPTPISLPRLVPAQGRMIDSVFIPGNTVVGINVQNIQNSPTLWYEPRTFHPERFLPSSDPRYDARFDEDIKAAFVPFSTGPRNCLGGK